jgi:broad-specificity NMP kinase
MSIYFITGTSGSGKTTLLKILRKKLPPESFVVYDFDENGVPVHPDVEWRKVTTDYWLEHANKNQEKRINTIICGVTVPSEVLKAYNLNKNSKVYFGLVKSPDQVITRRLEDRGWSEKMIKDNINWQKFLEKDVASQANDRIVETNDTIDPQVVANEFIDWIKKNDEFSNEATVQEA